MWRAPPSATTRPNSPEGTTSRKIPRTAMYQNLHFLPIAVSITIPINFIITYVWAVLLGHVEPGFPYISDTGSLPPESCLFSMMLNISTVLMACCVYLQYRNIGEILAANRDCGVSERLNTSSGWIGFASCLGLSIVANFQQQNVLVVHLFGAAVCFVGGTVYFCLQTWFTHRLRQHSAVTPALFRTRVTLSVLCVVLMALTISTAIVAYTQFDGGDKLHWRQQDGGWSFHLASTVSEWLMSAAFCGFIASFAKDFKRICVESPVVRIQYTTST